MPAAGARQGWVRCEPGLPLGSGLFVPCWLLVDDVDADAAPTAGRACVVRHLHGFIVSTDSRLPLPLWHDAGSLDEALTVGASLLGVEWPTAG